MQFITGNELEKLTQTILYLNKLIDIQVYLHNLKLIPVYNYHTSNNPREGRGVAFLDRDGRMVEQKRYVATH